MPADPESQPPPELDRLEAATDQAIAACGGSAREAVKALIVANEFLEVRKAEISAKTNLSPGIFLSSVTAIASIRRPRQNSPNQFF